MKDDFSVVNYPYYRAHTYSQHYIAQKEILYVKLQHTLEQHCKSLNSMTDYDYYKGLFAQKERMPVRERDEKERQRVKFSFLDAPCVSAASLKFMGVSSQKEDMRHRAE